MTLEKSQRNEFREYLSRPEFRDSYASLSGVHSELGVKILEVDETGVSMSFLPTDLLESSIGSGTCDLGPVATVMDSAMGMSVMLSLESFSSIATLELRTDWVKSPSTKCEIRIETTVDEVVENLIFVQAKAWQGDSLSPFCRGTARFMLTKGKGNLSKVIMEAAEAQEFPDERGDL